jgi:heme/copper-type cytochrome/quinol oxidase subunit 3
MTADTTVAYEVDEVMERRTLLLGTRLFLAANTMLMGAMLFAYLYLRSQNNNGMWRPGGIADLSSVAIAVTLLIQLGCLVAAVAAVSTAARGGAIRVMASVALVLSIVAGAAHVWVQYNLGNGWTIDNGTYTAVSEYWFGILIVEILMGCVWLLSLVVPGPRASDPAASSRHLRAFTEFWAYMLVVSTLVWLLVRLV